MKNNIFITIKKELRETLRDKKSLLMMILTPLMIPLFIFIFSFIYDTMTSDTNKETYTIGVNYEISEIEKDIINSLEFNTNYYKTDKEIEKAYKEGKISAYIKKEDNNYKIYTNSMSEDGRVASYLINSYLDNYNMHLGQMYLSSINADVSKVYNNISYQYEKMKVESNDFVNQIITTGFIFAIMSITLTAIYSATDSTAGEKERGTLETLLTFPIKSSELIMGKYLAITFSCLITSIISTVLTILSFKFSSGLFSIYDNVVFSFNFKTITIALLIMLAYSLFISGLTIAIASFTKTYKEAQSALTPLSLFTMIPMFLDILKVNLTPGLSLIPMVNHTMILNQVVCGKINIINIIIMFTSTIIYSLIILGIISKQYKSEKILFSI